MTKDKKTVRIKCNLTGYTQGIQKEYYQKKIEQYGSEENFIKFYIQNKIIVMFTKGYKLTDISNLLNFELDESKKDYYEELLKFHINDNKMMLPQPSASKQSVSFNKSDDDIIDFINYFKMDLRDNMHIFD